MPPNESELAAAMSRLRDGDRSVLGAVFDALDGPVRALTRKLLGGGPDADDAAQEALLEVFASVDRYEPGRDPVAWALTIAGWECRTVRRRHQRARTTSLEGEGPSDAPSPEALAMKTEVRTAIADVLASLGPVDHATLEALLADEGAGPTFRKRKERLLDRLRVGLGRIYG